MGDGKIVERITNDKLDILTALLKAGLNVQLIAKLPGSNQILTFDIETGSLAVIDIIHHMVHLGLHWTVNYNISRNIGQNLDILIRTGNDDIHLLWVLGSESSSTIYYYRDTTYSAAGTLLTQENNYEESTNTNDCIFTHTPTITNAGVQKESYVIGAGGGQRLGGTINREFETILARNSNHLLRITSAANSNNCHAVVFYYKPH